jgi:DNA/RNA-binding domain of Phe-tRNA-synthetase-like protein
MELSVVYALDGWRLYTADLTLTDEPEGLEDLRRQIVGEVQASYEISTLASHPTVAAMRQLFRQAGTDPTRYRPSSEALLRRLLKSAEMPSILPFVDLNNCLSASLAVPCCVMAKGTFEGPFELRSGASGEAYESLRGPFNLEGRPLLLDQLGPCDSPITGSQRVKVTPETTRCTLVSYLPAGTVELAAANAELDRLLASLNGLARSPHQRAD